MRESMDKIIAMLDETATEIRKLEAEAQEALMERDDKATHRKKLVEKTMLLMDLPESAEHLLKELEPKTAGQIGRALKDFARRAGNAMGVDSVFYMAALLYPDDYKEGDRNDLEVYIDGLRK